MPMEGQLAHRNVASSALPYRTNQSPTATDPCFVTGSQDLLTSVAGYCQRRPGFSDNVEAVATTFNNLQRLFTWDRFDGTFIEMACQINASGFAQVYKRLVGTDNSFVSLFTDTVATVFDFVVSNNTVYFSNGHVAKKWNPSDGLSNWGIAMSPTSSATGPNGVGTGSDVAFSGGTAWSNPGNITANDGSFATVTMTQGSGGAVGPNFPTSADSESGGIQWANPNNIFAQDAVYSTATGTAASNGDQTQNLVALAYNFSASLPSTATINGITVTVGYARTSGGTHVTLTEGNVILLKNRVPVGSDKGTGADLSNPTTTITYGGSSDLWGATWTGSDINNAQFGILINAALTSNNGIAIPALGVDYIKITINYTPAAGGLYSDYLQGTNPGFGIASGTVLGILVEIKGLQSVANSNTSISVQMLKSGNLVGTAKTGTNLGLSNAFVSYGGSADLWGATWSTNDINASTFGVSIQAVSNTSGTVTWSVDFVRITVYSFGGPNVTFTGTGLTANIGYQYVYCYGNSVTGHLSSPCLASNVVKPANQSMSIPLVASSDPQVNQIRVFRSTDSVAAATTAGIYFEIPTSPYANSNASVTDSAADTALLVNSIAPLPSFNDPPVGAAGFRGMVYFSGRIWGFANNKVYFSALEECVQGVPEESFVSGAAGNFWTFDQPVQGLGVAGNGDNQTLIVFCGGRIYGIFGNTLDTFRRFVISRRRGCRNQNCISSMGGMVTWLDSSNQIWATDGSSMQELSIDIRPDLAGITISNCSMTFHAAGTFHWLVFSTGAKLYVYDLDTEQWMPPWSFSCNSIFSGEVSAGSYQLIAATSPKALQLSTTAHNDNGASYQMVVNTNLYALVPDFSRRFSVASLGIYDEPSRTGYPALVQVDANSVTLSDVLICFDDDPFNAATTYTSIFTNKQDVSVTANRSNGVNIVQNVFPLTAITARWAGIKIKGQNADDNLKIYGWFLAYKNTRP